MYSFGFLMWEVLHEKVPFDGNVKTAIEYVVDEDARPMILTLDENETLAQTTETMPHQSFPASERDEVIKLTEDLANIIRRCWQTDPSERPRLFHVVHMLKE